MPLTLTLRGWGLVVAAIGFGASWFVVGLRDLWYLVSLLAALVALALLVVLLASLLARFEVRLSASDPTPTDGDDVILTATLRHRLPASLRLGVVWSGPAGAERGPKGTAPGRGGRDHRPGPRSADRVQPDGRGRATARFRWGPLARGPASPGVAALTLRDPLGLVQRRIRRADVVDLLVLPRVPDGLPGLLGDEGWGSDAELDGRASQHGSGSPAGAVREYRTGDALRHIHWKQSARQGELLVNLLEDPDGRERSLLLVTSGEGYEEVPEADEDFEAAVTAAAALATHWLRQGHPVRLHLGQQASIRLGSETDALRALARATQGPEAERPPSAPLDAVVAGTLTPAVRELLGDRSAGPEGLLLTVGRNPGSTAPPGWRLIRIPSPRPRPASGAQTRPTAEAGRRERDDG